MDSKEVAVAILRQIDADGGTGVCSGHSSSRNQGEAHCIMIVTSVNWYQTPLPLKLMIDRLVCADGGNPDPTTTHGKHAAEAKEPEMKGWIIPVISRDISSRRSCTEIRKERKTSGEAFQTG